ncbi:MAG: hypothetical protein CVU57_10240 [Deltaproteobacteria bacterium HGW-Deltaproteobacteria-15]|nr:MAG: hypothetical protein CVU57_10240 [Deltaproteobacteria bacterium HGW-Deltaproteobacteria-15]
MRRATKSYNLVNGNPDLRKEWHPTRNGSVKPEEVAPFSSSKFWWICEKGHEWEARAYNRTRGQGCPFCAGKRSSDLPLREWSPRMERSGSARHSGKSGILLRAMSWSRCLTRHGLTSPS